MNGRPHPRRGDGPERGPRLFFGLWPDAQLAGALEAWAQKAQQVTGGRITPASAIHLTLAFLGEVPADRLHAAIEAAERVRAAAHRFELARPHYWPHNRIVWVGPADIPEALGALAAKLRAELERTGFALDTREFQSHVTLIRQARETDDLPALAPLSWEVDEFVLVRSTLAREGPTYDVLERFALVGQG